MKQIEWVYIPGGISLHGDAKIKRPVKDLLWSRSLLTYSHLTSFAKGIHPLLPINEISFDEAVTIAHKLGGRLPTSTEWEWMAMGPDCRKYPWGNTEWAQDKANINESLLNRPTIIGSYPHGATPEGILDVSGNLWEWTNTQIPHNGVIIRGGSYKAKLLHIECKFLNAAPAAIKSKGIGLRLVKDI